MPKKAKQTIGVVVRVSDVRGRDKRGDRFISPSEQVRAATTYCRAAGFDVQVIEPMDLNISHKTPLDDRPAMGLALRLVEAGELAGIAVSSQDRIGPLMLTRELKARLFQAGGIFKIADNPAAETLDARGYAKLPAEYMSLMHEAQREEIGLRWAAADRNARERGVWPQREPFGYRRGTDGRVVIDRKAAEQVREAFRMRAANKPISVIARRFGWSHSTARQRLANVAYMGIDGLVPAIVTRDLFDAVQRGRTTQPIPPGKVTRNMLLPGLARCAGCGRTLKVVSRQKKDGGLVSSYYCKDAATHVCVERALVHCNALDHLVDTWFRGELKSAGRRVDVVAAGKDLEDALAEREAAEAELIAYVELTSAIDRAVFERGYVKRQARAEAARDRVQDLQSRVTAVPLGGDLLTLWSDFTPAERRDVLAGFVDRVEVSRGASRDLAAHVQVFWSDGTLALGAKVERAARAASA